MINWGAVAFDVARAALFFLCAFCLPIGALQMAREVANEWRNDQTSEEFAGNLVRYGFWIGTGVGCGALAILLR